MESLINIFSRQKISRKQVVNIFLFAMLLLGISSGIFRSIFNNYLKEIHSFTTADRGIIEFPRELFGFLMVFIVGVFYYINESRLIAIGSFLAGVSYLGLAFLSPEKSYLIFWILIFSFGSHIVVNLRNTLALMLSNPKEKGYFFGRMAARGSIGFIIGTIITWLTFSYSSFQISFFIASITSFIACLLFATLPIYKYHNFTQRNKFIFKKIYIHYYALALLFGVRKQIFMVFAPWFIVKTLNQPTNTIAIILFIAAILGIYIKPLLGKLLDYWGERKTLIYDSLILGFISFGYILASHLSHGIYLLLIVSIFYIVDEILFALKSAREIYLSKIAESKKDITPTIATGLSLEHVVSMTTPMLAGIIWVNYGYEFIFAFCGILSVITAFYVFKFINS
jgi:predicted MFS family arabinose efflux permease